MSPRSRKLLVAALGSVASAGFIFLALRQLDIADVGAALRTLDPWPWIPLAVLAYILGQLVRGVRCRALVSRETRLRLATATNIVVLGYAVNNVAPARLGELARAGLLSERTGIPFSQSLTVTFLERILDGWIIVLLFAISSRLITNVDPWIDKVSVVAAIVLGAISVGLVILMLAPFAVARLGSRAVRFIGRGAEDRVWRLVIHVGAGLAYLKRPTDALLVGLTSAAVWLIEALMFLAVLPAFGLEPRYEWALLVMAVTNLGILSPSSPGHIGPFHFFCAKALTSLGTAGAVATSYAIAVHLVFYIPITAWGCAVLLRYGIEIGSMFSLSRARETRDLEEVEGVPMYRLGTLGSRPSEPRRAGRLVRAITAALLPADRTISESAVAEVADFVQGQIDALSPRLRTLYRVATIGFRVAVRVRHLRSFCALAPETRRAIVYRWAYGRTAFRRQYFRLYRSTALLAYFELYGVRHPQRTSDERPIPLTAEARR